MKKTFVLMVGVLLILVWTVSVHASTVTLFKKSTADANWPAFAEALQAQGDLQNGMIDTAVLAAVAHGVYQSNGGQTPLEAFVPAWLQQHGLGDRIRVEEFRALAQAGRLTTTVRTARLGFTNEVAFGAPVEPSTSRITSRTSATQSAPDQAPTPAAAASVSPQDVRALRSQLGQLRTEVEGMAVSQQNDALTSQVVALDEQLSTLVANQSQFVTDEQFQAALVEVVGQVDVLIASQSDLVTTTQLSSTVSGIQSRLATLEAAPLAGWSTQQIVTALAVAGALILLLVLLTIVIGRRTRPQAASAQSVADTASTTEMEEGIVSSVRLATVAGQAVPQQKRDIVLPERLSEQLQQLSSEKLSIQLPMKVDGVEYQLRFSHVKPGYVSIDGITSQTREVKVAGVQSVLKRAAGQGRILGLQTERQIA